MAFQGGVFSLSCNSFVFFLVLLLKSPLVAVGQVAEMRNARRVLLRMCVTIIPRRRRWPPSENNSPDLNKQHDFLLSQHSVLSLHCVCETNRELRDESLFSPDAGEKKTRNGKRTPADS